MLLTERCLSSLPYFILVVPLAAGLSVYLFCRERGFLRQVLVTLSTIIPLALVLLLVPFIQKGIVLTGKLDLLPPLGFSYRLDRLSLYILVLFVFFGFFVSLYTQEYMKNDNQENSFMAFLLLVLGGCYGVALSGDFFTFFLFFEFMSLMYFVLLAHGQHERSTGASLKFLFMAIIAGVVLFLALVIIYRETGSLAFGSSGLITDSSALNMIAFVGFVIALGIKAALFPLHLWLPDAYTYAPLPAAVISSVIMLKTGVYGLMRAFGDVFGFAFLKTLDWSQALLMLAAVTILFGSLVALSQDDLIRRLAYSGIAQVGYIILGIALLSETALIGASYHILAHAFMKGTMFLCAGSIIKGTGLRKISRLRGVGYRLPVTMICFFIASLTAVGIPPFNIFISKWFIGMGALESGLPLLVLVLLISSFLNACYYLPIAINAFLGKKRQLHHLFQDVQEASLYAAAGLAGQTADLHLGFGGGWAEPPLRMMLPTLVLTLGCVIFGLLSSNWPLELIKSGLKAFF